MKRFLAFLVALNASLTGLTGVAPASAVEVSCTIVGTGKSDVITGTPGNDVICAGAGNDLIYSLGGDDIIKAGPGNDQIYAGSGNDSVQGESGNDYLNGSDGADKLDGGAGRDKLAGLGGQDLLMGGSGADSISGGNSNDLLDGGTGGDTLRTGAGMDICSSDDLDSRLDACTIDNAGPAISIPSDQEHTFTAGEVAVFRFKTSDISGVSGVYGFLGGAPGWVTEWCGFGMEADLISGTARDGTFEILCEIPKNAVNADYTLFIRASDIMGNASDGPSIDFKVVGGSNDNKSPEVTKVEIPDSAARGKAFEITVVAKDETGIQGIYGWFMLVGGGFSDGKVLYAPGEEPKLNPSGTESTFTQRFSFDINAPQGTYSLWISVRDTLGNRDFYDTGLTVSLTD